MIDLPTDLPADIVPLSWLLGVWEGTGVIDYEADGASFQGEFAHRVSFSHDGGDYVNYAASAWLLGDGDDEARTPLVAETGYWRLARPAADVDAGPALIVQRQAQGVLFGLDQIIALQLPRRPERLGLGQPDGFGQAAGGRGREKGFHEGRL